MTHRARPVVSLIAALLPVTGPLVTGSPAHGGSARMASVDREGRVGIQTVRSDPTAVSRPFGALTDAPVTNFVELDSPPEGDMPRAVAITPDGQYAVVVNRDTDLMVFIDLATVQIVASVTVGDYPIDVAISGDGQYALSTNVFSNSVSVVDVATQTLVTDIPVSGEQPFRVLTTADGSKAVVGVINDGTASSFSVLDLFTLTEERTFPSTPQGVTGFFFTPAFAMGGELTTSFALTPDGQTVVLPWRGGNAATLYDVSTGDVAASLPVATAPSAVDVASDGSIAVIVHDGSPSHVSVIDLATQSVTASHTVTTMLDPFIARLTPDAAYVMAAISNNVVFIDLATGATAATVSTGVVGDIEISADQQYAYVSNFSSAIINLSTRTLAAVIPFGACVDAAASKTSNVAVAINNRFREEVYAFNIAGAASTLRGWTRSGPSPEADCPKEIAISPDGHTALVANATSRNVSFVDLATGTLLATVDTGDVPRESAYTPDGAYVLVCNGDSNTVSIIDAGSKQVVKTLNTPTRPTRVRISPDSQKAYVCTVAGTDSLYFINLAGANSSIITSFPIGQMGAANGYPYSEVSGMELSPDGQHLVLTISFDDVLRIVDTQTHSVVASVAVGDFPIRALFSPDGSRIFVANSFSDDVAIVKHEAGLWFTDAIISGIEFPLDMALDADSEHLYVGRCDFQNPAVSVVDLSAGTMVKTIALPGLPREGEYLATTDQYIVTTDDGSLVRIAADGAEAAIEDITAISSSAPDMRYSQSLDLAVASAPFTPDGLDLIHFSDPAVLGDLDGDGTVGPADLAILLGAWGGSGSADLDGDGAVGPSDLAILLGAWTG